MKKHIIYLHPHFTLPGGAGNYILETAKLISKKEGYVVHVISGKQNNKIINGYNNINFFETKIPLSSSFLFWIFFPIRTIKIIKSIKNIIKNNQGEFTIFAHVFPANRWGGIFKMFNKKHKFVFMCHEPSAFIWERKWINSIPSNMKRYIAIRINPIMRFFDKKLVGLADIIISNSKFTSKRAVNIYGKNHDIAYPGYDDESFFIENIKKEKYFLSVGRLTKFKRVYFIVDSFLSFHKNNKEFKLKILGEGEEYNNLKKYIKDKEGNYCIELLGSVNFKDLISHYQKAYATLFASIDEPFGMVPIESMACGTVAIGHNSGGMKETIPKEFRYDDESGIINIMKNVSNNPNKEFKEINKFTRKETVLVLLKYL